MYIKLGTIKANRYYDDPDDFMILSEVPSSSMSYESPTRVRSLDELDIWFGKTYSEYSYLPELIESGVTLYLYKPVNPGTQDTTNYIDMYLEGTTKFPSIDYIKEYIPARSNTRYHSADGIWIFYDNSWILENDLVSEESSKSLLNRDTLIISESGKYCHPNYFPDNGKVFKTPEVTPEITYSRDSGVYVTKISWTGEPILNGEYLGFKSLSGRWIICHKGDGEDIKNKFGRTSTITYKSINDFEDLVNIIGSDYTLKKAVSDKEYLIYSNTRRDIIDMVSISSVSIEQAKEEEDVIYSNILNSSEGIACFWSKTIGRDSNIYDIDESRIKISIEDALEDGYIIKILRYGYSEYYIGNIKGAPGEEGILDRINRESKLVYCSTENLEKLPEGEFYLDGAKTENPTAEWYKKSMKLLIGETLEDSIVPDFFMIPNISLFGERNDEQIFLPYATAGEFQFLISEIKEEYLDNYLGDKENRLLYFYGNMIYQNQLRPSYYLYLKNLLENLGNAKYQAKDIIYKPILNEDIGNEEKVHNPYMMSKEGILERYKCNYLVSNNQYYYYNKYQNGENYTTSGILRFIIGKLYREIQKRRWEIIGQKFNSLMKKKIEGIINRVAIFSNVKSMKISSYFPYPELELLDVEVDIWTKELLQNNITLDITINYKKYGN